jgi:hypothetical protein
VGGPKTLFPFLDILFSDAGKIFFSFGLFLAETLIDTGLFVVCILDYKQDGTDIYIYILILDFICNLTTPHINKLPSMSQTSMLNK